MRYRNPLASVSLLSLCFLAACGSPPSEAVASTSAALVVRAAIDRAAGAMILGACADRRFVAYGTECDAGDARTTLKLLDDATGAVTVLARGAQCMPRALVFSPDGWLVAFPDGAGHLQVHDARTDRTAVVSRADRSPIGVAFSPDSRWFVVASAGDTPSAAALDAWDADLGAHVSVSEDAGFNPFGPAAQSVKFSPDGARILFVDALGQDSPIGALSQWTRASRALRTIARGVPSGSFVVRDDWRFVAYVEGASAPSGGPVLGAPGSLVMRDLALDHAHTVERGVVEVPFGFAGDSLVYGLPTAGAPTYALKAHAFDRAATTTIDTDVFAPFNPYPAIAIAPGGDRIAYTRGFDPSRSAAELRVASGTGFTKTRSITSSVVPFQGYGWLDDGADLVFLHDPTSSMPGSTAGTLSAWETARGKTTDIATEVTPIGLAIDASSSDVLFVAAYDMDSASGDLESWTARSRATRLLGHHAAVMSIDRSPDRTFVGFLALTLDPTREQPPSTELTLSRTMGPQRTLQVAPDVTSLSSGGLGRVVYTTRDGLFGAFGL